MLIEGPGQGGWTATLDNCPPAFCTPLTPDRPNLGVQARNAARMLGFPYLTPWQDHFLHLATEYEEGNPQDGIVPWWRYLTLSVPRQCGKSECVLCCLLLLRWLGFYRSDESPKMAYTSYSIEACTDMFDTKLGRRLRECAWGRQNDVYFNHAPANFHMRLGKANRALRGGRIRILSNSGKSGRGGTEDMCVIDEAREFGDDSTREQTLDPLMNTRAAPQLIIASTMGREEAGYFHRKVSAGRETAVLQGRGEWPVMRLAYCEWGVGDVRPDSYDPGDPGVWRRAHPMLGHCHWDEARMGEKYDMARSEDDVGRFQLEYLNQAVVPDDAPAVPWAMVEAVETPVVGWDDLGGNVVLAVFSEPGSYYLSAAAAGGGCLRVVRPVEEAGEVRRVPVYAAEDWLTGYLSEHPQVRHLVFLEGNDLENLLAKFKVAGRGLRRWPVKFSEYKGGCQTLKKALVMETVRVERSQFLRMAVQASEVQDGYDQSSWYWRRKPKAQAYADELRAAVLAWMVADRLANKARPGIYVPKSQRGIVGGDE